MLGQSISWILNDMSKVTTSQLKALRDYIDGHNKHNIRLEEKDVPIEGTDKNYKYFAMQVKWHRSFLISVIIFLF